MKLQESGQHRGNVMKRIAAVAIAVLCVAGVLFATGVSKLEAQYEFDTTWGAKGRGNGEFKYVEDLAIDADGNILVYLEA